MTQAEVERRGRAYDEVDCSYLFELNLDCAVDSRRIGNPLRSAAATSSLVHHVAASLWAEGMSGHAGLQITAATTTRSPK